MEQQFQYYAFISYKREDEKWAKWLQDRLRWYKLPSKLCRQITRLPKKVWPVFRDNTDLDSGRLEENIRHELERSHYLIVICSPEAARSPWVGKEVKYFATLHGADKIIPFVVSGIPYSNDIETECIHEQIKAISQEELLAINVREEGIGSFAMKKKRAFIRVVARLLDIKFNTLWQPYERILRIRKWSTGIGVVLFLFVLFILWDYYRTKNEYFADYVDRWGIPEGVVELSAEQVKKRSTHYRFEYTHRSILGKGKGTLKRVVFANSAGFPIEHNFSEYVDRSSIQQIESRKDRRGQSVIEIEYQNSKQKPLIVAYIAGDSLQYVDLKSLDKGMGIGLTSSFTSITSNAFESMFSNSKSEIRRYRLIRDRQGFIIRKLFKKYNGNDDIAACDAKGIYGFDYLLDSIGRPRLVRFIGFEGFNFPNNMGIASKKYNYDEYGNISVIAYLDPAGNPVLNEQRWATYTRKCDENGNIVKGVYLGIDQKICPLSNGGGIIGKEYDEHGNSITESIFDKDGQLAWGREGVARCVAKYNKQGRIIETANYGTDGNLCFNKKGYARLLSTYDDCGNVIEMAYYGVDGAPCFNKKGYAKWIGRYDKYGNMIESAYFDTDGEPVRDKEGVMKVEAVYNNKGYISSISYVDAGGNLVPNKIGIAQVTITYDNNNNLEKISFKDADGAPCPIANVRLEYDESGNQTGQFVSCLEDKLFQPAGFNWRAKYDKGNLVEKVYLNNVKEPYLNPNEGYAKYIAKYNERGRLIELSFFDTEEKPCLNNKGYAKVSYGYDEWGNVTEILFLGVDGKPCTDSSGVARCVMRYDERGNKIEEATFDPEGNPCLNAQGAAKMTAVCDSWGNVTEMTYWGTDGRLGLNKEGFAKLNFKYDERGFREETAYFDVNNKLCMHTGGYAKVLEKYDPRGNCTEVAYRDENDRPCLLQDGYAKLSFQYDDRGNVVKQVYFGTDDKPCINTGGFTAISQKYNEKGMITEVAFWDIAEKPCFVNCYFMEKTEFDDWGRIIEKKYLDTENKLCKGGYGFARMTVEYDRTGNSTVRVFDENNHETMKKSLHVNEIIQ